MLGEKFTADNGNLILDCHGLTLLDPPKMGAELNNIAGLCSSGASRPHRFGQRQIA